MKRLAFALLAALPLAACGLHPMYAGGSSGAVAQGLASVDVAPIEGKTGWARTAAPARRATGSMCGWMTSSRGSGC